MKTGLGTWLSWWSAGCVDFVYPTPRQKLGSDVISVLQEVETGRSQEFCGQCNQAASFRLSESQCLKRQGGTVDTNWRRYPRPTSGLQIHPHISTYAWTKTHKYNVHETRILPRQMAQRLRALAALAEDPSSFPTPTWWLTSAHVPQDPMLSSGLCGH